MPIEKVSDFTLDVFSMPSMFDMNYSVLLVYE